MLRQNAEILGDGRPKGPRRVSRDRLQDLEKLDYLRLSGLHGDVPFRKPSIQIHMEWAHRVCMKQMLDVGHL